jgi:hypothetical protein
MAGDRTVAIGVVWSEKAQIVKAIAGEVRTLRA